MAVLLFLRALYWSTYFYFIFYPYIYILMCLHSYLYLVPTVCNTIQQSFQGVVKKKVSSAYSALGGVSTILCNRVPVPQKMQSFWRKVLEILLGLIFTSVNSASKIPDFFTKKILCSGAAATGFLLIFKRDPRSAILSNLYLNQNQQQCVP